jgi:hypothetical protein
LRLEGKSQVEIIPTCVSLEGRIMPYCITFHNCLRLLVLAGMHPVYLVGSLLESKCPAALCLLIIILFMMR